jgi:hypothetical protein
LMRVTGTSGRHFQPDSADVCPADERSTRHGERRPQGARERPLRDTTPSPRALPKPFVCPSLHRKPRAFPLILRSVLTVPT